MADVISLDRNRRQRRLILLEAAGRLMRCAGCQLRCSRCGLGVDDEGAPLPEYEIILCPTCYTEYEAYRQRLEGRADPEAFWLNDAWAETWTTWLAHQKAVAEYRRSKEFVRLLHDPPDLR